MNKTTFVNEYELPVEITKDRGGYFAVCRNWKDCYAQGDTIDEAVSEITAVAASLIELYQEEGKKIPLKLQKQSENKSKFNFDLSLIVPVV